MSKVAVSGSFVVDLIARSSRLPMPGETAKGPVFKMGPGGEGFNQCVVTHKAGAEVVMVIKVERDSSTNAVLDTMADLGTDKEHIFVPDDRETGIALILVDENTSQSEIIIVPRTCNTITDEEIGSIENAIKEPEYVLLQLEVNQDTSEMVMDMASRYGRKMTVNTVPYSPAVDNFLSKAHMVTPNEAEAEELTGIPVSDFQSTEKAAAYFCDKGVQGMLIALDSRGILVSSDDREEVVPTFKVGVVDTTGAGDVFNGGLLAALAEGKDIWGAVCFANGLAALSVQELGTTPSMPFREEIDAFLQNT